MKDIITDEDIYHMIANETDYSLEVIEDIGQKISSKLYENFINEKSVKFKELPILKAKSSKANFNENSPRTPRKKHMIVTMKIRL